MGNKEIDHGAGSHDIGNCGYCRKKMKDKEKANQTDNLKKMSEKVIKRLCKVNNCKDPFLNIGALFEALQKVQREAYEKGLATKKDVDKWVKKNLEVTEIAYKEGQRDTARECAEIAVEDVKDNKCADSDEMAFECGCITASDKIKTKYNLGGKDNGDKEKADKILNTKPHGKNWLRNDIVLALNLAREEVRREERINCKKIAEDESNLDMVGGSTGNAVGTAKKIANAIKESGEI